MSVIRKVINLNQPVKIFEFTPIQLVLMVLSLGTALLVAGKVPSNWKVGDLPAGFLIGLLIVCMAIVFVKFTEIKPLLWWRNLIFYRLKLAPQQFFPGTEPAKIYPDTTIIEAPKRGQTSEFYIAEYRDPSTDATDTKD
jgi:hypothetical protein